MPASGPRAGSSWSPGWRRACNTRRSRFAPIPASNRQERGNALLVRLNTGEQLEVDHVLFATGYQVDRSRRSGRPRHRDRTGGAGLRRPALPPLRGPAGRAAVVHRPVPVSADSPLPIAAESQAAVLALHCLESTDPAVALKALSEYVDPPPGTAVGGQGTAQRALVTAQLLGVRGTPYLIVSDGRLHQGRPADLADWLAGDPTAGTGEGSQ